ncbi:N-acetyltransferase [Pseudoruegeria sp. HB172150]|uniref:GNAT family N-acetyltransferase n=1 Tax=Pseudoruegeria sp. HB172150 TaxID=2721164 RepID=UPI00155255C1|nr:GNAT family N-acetyltransferase [Pseudoruegeria sp. HB172150]
MPLELRAATTGDLTDIRDLQIASWRRAYKGILSADFLSSTIVDELSTRWSVLPGTGWTVDTAWLGPRLAGFVSVDRNKGAGAYVDNLHVAGWAQGQGVGRALMARAARQLAEEGIGRIWLTVIRENAGARAFYRKIGGVEGPERVENLYGEMVQTYPVEWTESGRLAALSPS